LIVGVISPLVRNSLTNYFFKANPAQIFYHGYKPRLAG
jgi:hypothetical protein